MVYCVRTFADPPGELLRSRADHHSVHYCCSIAVLASRYWWHSITYEAPWRIQC
jgi:hypothetical protein